MATVTRRSTSLNIVRGVFQLLDALKDRGILPPVTFESLASVVPSCKYNFTPAELRSAIESCVQDEVLRVTPLGSYVLPESIDPMNDCYCFECHEQGDVLPCSTCQRSYHAKCVSPNTAMQLLPGGTWQCPICQSCPMNDVSCYDDVLPNRLERILQYVYQKGARLTTLPNTAHSVSNPTQYRLLVAKHMDLSTMKSKLQSCQYVHPRQFLADFQLLVHNVIILNGGLHELARVASELLSQVRAEIEMLEDPQAVLTDGTSDLCDVQQSEQDMLDINLSAAEHQVLPLPVKDKSKKKKRQVTDGAIPLAPASIKKQRGSSKGGASFLSTDSGSNDDMAGPGDVNGTSSAAGVAGPSTLQDQIKATVPSVVSVPIACNCHEKYRKAIMQLQESWREDYAQDRERVLAETTEKMHNKFDAEYGKMKADLSQRYREDLEAAKAQLEEQYEQQLSRERVRLTEQHRTQLSQAKQKQWCKMCEHEAIYHCCWNTAYCSVECQQKHWPQHRRACRRKKQQN